MLLEATLSHCEPRYLSHVGTRVDKLLSTYHLLTSWQACVMPQIHCMKLAQAKKACALLSLGMLGHCCLHPDHLRSLTAVLCD